MSSRALRKLKREEEEARQLAALQAEQAAEDGSDEAEDEVEDTLSARLKSKPVSNAFDMLDGANGDDHSESGGADEEVDPEADGVERTAGSTSNPPKPTKVKKKKKKQKKRAREKAPAESTGRKAADEMDDIDRALQELSTKEPAMPATDADAAEETQSGD